MIVGWVRLTGPDARGVQHLEMLLHRRAHDDLPALLAHAAVALDATLDARTVCHVRSYEEGLLAGLCETGFEVVAEHALLVKPSVARVTERQLLIAALRAQSLGLETPGLSISHLDPLHAPARTRTSATAGSRSAAPRTATC